MTTDLPVELDTLTKRLDAARPLGFPCARDFLDTGPIQDLLDRFLNNSGDPDAPGIFPWHTRDFEQQVVDFVAKLFRAPPANYWGYVTTSGSEGNLNSLRIARAQFRGRNPLVLYWTSAHVSVEDAIDTLDLDFVRLRVRPPHDESRLDDLSVQVEKHRDRPLIVVATAGTTITEWVDNVAKIKAILRDSCAPHYVHVDAALSGIPLALLPEQAHTPFDFSAGADAITVSGHKFVGTTEPCGVLVVRDGLHRRLTRYVDYTASEHTTINGSRSGRTPLLLWWAFDQWGLQGLSKRASDARAVAAYALDRLRSEISTEWFRNLPGFTLVFPGELPPEITDKWALATSAGRTHLITMPGVTRPDVDEFVEDLKRTVGVLDTRGG